jgi:hypothetical protein
LPRPLSIDRLVLRLTAAYPFSVFAPDRTDGISFYFSELKVQRRR